MVYIVMVIEFFKQIIENVFTLDKIIIHTHSPKSVKLQAHKKSRVEQLLTTQVSPSVELVILYYYVEA